MLCYISHMILPIIAASEELPIFAKAILLIVVVAMVLMTVGRVLFGDPKPADASATRNADPFDALAQAMETGRSKSGFVAVAPGLENADLLKRSVIAEFHRDLGASQQPTVAQLYEEAYAAIAWIRPAHEIAVIERAASATAATDPEASLVFADAIKDSAMESLRLREEFRARIQPRM